MVEGHIAKLDRMKHKILFFIYKKVQLSYTTLYIDPLPQYEPQGRIYDDSGGGVV